MATLAELVVKIDTDLTGLLKGTTAATRAANQLGDRMRSAGAKITLGLTTPVALLGATFVKAAADMDSLTRGMTAVTGSASATRAQLARLSDVAKLPGLGFREAVQGSINLQAAGLSANTSERALRAFGNALATVGKGKADLDGVILALGQIASKGKVSAEEINQLAERVPQIRQAMIAAFGSADTERLGKAGIDATRFINGLIDQLLKLPQASGGAANAFENLSDSWFRARAAIGDQLLPAILPLIDGLAELATQARAADPATVRWAIAIGAVAIAIGPVIGLVGTLTTAVTGLTAALGIAGLVGTITTGGLLLALGGLSALFVKNKLDALDAASAAAQYRASLIGLSEGQLIAQRTAERMALSDLKVSQAALRQSGKAFERIVPAAPGHQVTTFRRGAGGGGTVRETAEMRHLGEEANRSGARISSLTQAIDQLHAAAATTTPPILPPNTTNKLTDAERAAQALADKLRQIQIAGADAAKALLGVQLAKERAGIVATADRLKAQILAPEQPDTKARQLAKQAGDAAKNAGGGFLDALAKGAGNLLAQFGPMGIALQAVNAVLQPLQPLLDALLVPFTIMGEIIGSLIVPVLRLLFQPLKYLGIVVSFIGEVIAKVAGAIATAIGSLVRGIGRLVNKLPGSPGDPLVKAGQAMIDLGNQFKDAAKDMAAKRKELEGLSFDDALDSTTAAANRLSEALINAAQGFKIERFRFAAADAGPPAGSSARSPAPRRSDAGAATASVIAPVAASLPPVTININGATDPDSVAEMVVAALNRWALSAPHMRATVAGLTP